MGPQFFVLVILYKRLNFKDDVAKNELIKDFLKFDRAWNICSSGVIDRQLTLYNYTRIKQNILKERIRNDDLKIYKFFSLISSVRGLNEYRVR